MAKGVEFAIPRLGPASPGWNRERRRQVVVPFLSERAPRESLDSSGGKQMEHSRDETLEAMKEAWERLYEVNKGWAKDWEEEHEKLKKARAELEAKRKEFAEETCLKMMAEETNQRLIAHVAKLQKELEKAVEVEPIPPLGSIEIDESTERRMSLPLGPDRSFSRLREQTTMEASGTRFCSRQGCSRRVFVDARTGIEYDYCGRTHANAALEEQGLQLRPPHGMCHKCKLDGCARTVWYDESSDRVHDFCCRSHAQQAQRKGLWPESNRRLQGQSQSHNRCALPSCSAPRFVDQDTGFMHDFCGRTHAKQAQERGMIGCTGTGVDDSGIH